MERQRGKAVAEEKKGKKGPEDGNDIFLLWDYERRKCAFVAKSPGCIQ
jgi:hypothetical protein